jgi:hypothetical protein
MLDKRSAGFFATRGHKEEAFEIGFFFALFVILCGYTNFKPL